MNSLEKIVWSQDSYFKTEAKNSGETSINLSNELYEFLGGKEGYIVFTLYKEDYLKATGLISKVLEKEAAMPLHCTGGKSKPQATTAMTANSTPSHLLCKPFSI